MQIESCDFINSDKKYHIRPKFFQEPKNLISFDKRNMFKVCFHILSLTLRA